MDRHPMIRVMVNMLLVMAAYSLSRVCFFLVNLPLFPNVTFAHFMEMMGGGVRFDLTAVLYLSSLYLLLTLFPLPNAWRRNTVYQQVARWTLIVPNIIGLVLNCVDMIYVRFTYRRTSMTFVDEFQHDGNILSIFLQGMVQYWYVTLIGCGLIALLVWGIRKVDVREEKGWLYYLRESGVFVVSVYFIVIGIRGGFGAYTRPITLSNALQYTNTPQESMVVLNTPFSIMRSSDSQTYQHPDWFSSDELEHIYSPLHPALQDGFGGGDNVVVIILESFSKEYIGFYNKGRADGYEGYTPFLDSLIGQSVTYTHSFASGRKSIDAMPSVLSSIPMLIEPYIVTPYSTNAIQSIASCLNGKGYTTAFFHGAPNGSMGFQAYARAAGFQAYYGMDEYDGPAAFDGTWAIWDEEFLQYYARTMDGMQEPFMTAVFTASSHHPFKVPERYEGRFPMGTQPIHQCIGYSDNALREFFRYAQHQPWYNHTLFVLTADHTNEPTLPEYATAKGLFEVPIVFYYPGRSAQVDSQIVMSQTDIMPEILEWLGYDQPYFAFGQSTICRDAATNCAVCYNSGCYQLLTDSLILQFDGENIVGLYNYVQDPLLQNNMKDERDMTSSLIFLKAYIQQYIDRMINNQLTWPTNE